MRFLITQDRNGRYRWLLQRQAVWQAGTPIHQVYWHTEGMMTGPGDPDYSMTACACEALIELMGADRDKVQVIADPALNY